MGPRPVGTPDPEMHVIYDGDKVKRFFNLYEARKFWMRMHKAGRHPHYKNPNKEKAK